MGCTDLAVLGSSRRGMVCLYRVLVFAGRDSFACTGAFVAFGKSMPEWLWYLFQGVQQPNSHFRRLDQGVVQTGYEPVA